MLYFFPACVTRVCSVHRYGAAKSPLDKEPVNIKLPHKQNYKVQVNNGCGLKEEAATATTFLRKQNDAIVLSRLVRGIVQTANHSIQTSKPVKVYNINGQLIKALSVPFGGEAILDVNDLPAGMYILSSMGSDHSIISRKIILQ